MTFKEIVKKIIPPFLLSFYHYVLVFLGALIFIFPSKKLTVIGVTGTSGKSTTVDFITKILEENREKVASISSIRFKIGAKEWKNELKMTTPGRFKIQKFLRKALDEKCKYVVLEVTSEGIKQFRHRFINFNTAVFTNLSKEHIESHGGFENYRNEKIKLFKATPGTHIINADDENSKYFLNIPSKKTITFSIKKPADVMAKNVVATKFKVDGIEFSLNLLGDFNVYNALAAIAVAENYEVPMETCKKALEKVEGIPGRMEIIQKDPFLVVVDYAHTPEQLENLYRTFSIRSQKPGASKLICVLGSCGGGRDKWKRPVLGKIAEQYCKEIIITNEDPYDENPNQILSEIKSGISNSQFLISNFYEILDRHEAIKKAIQLAKPGDTVIITGKGSEPWMCVENGKKIPWDDRQIARDTLKKPTIDNYL
ncbi:MAG: UDP-N-acetylmuramoyl-L-alanyl-D-glutamate--2,6-diaminopimelate ligase [Patescibacteria group bacterium]